MQVLIFTVTLALIASKSGIRFSIPGKPECSHNAGIAIVRRRFCLVLFLQSLFLWGYISPLKFIYLVIGSKNANETQGRC